MTSLTVLLLKIFFFFAPQQAQNIPASIYDFKVAGLTGGSIDFSKYKGKKILIVNTASECGYTPQYADLQATYEKYKGKFDQGWDKLREETFARQKALGVIPQDAKLTERPKEIPAWDA